MSNIPSQVARQSEAADALINALSGNTSTEAPDTGVIDNQQQATETVTDVNDNTVITDGKAMPDPQSVVTESAPVTAVETAQQQGNVEYWKQQAETWEHRYGVLQGKYNKEIAGVNQKSESDAAELDQLRRKCFGFEQQVQQLTSQLEELNKEKLKEESNIFKDPKVMENLAKLDDEFGPEFSSTIKAILEANNEKVDSRLDQLKQDKPVEPQVTEPQSSVTPPSSGMTTQEKMDVVNNKLKDKGIDFSRVDSDPLFHDWLSKYDSESGIQRQQQLMNLFGNNEFDSVAGMYISYVQESNIMNQNANTQVPTQEPVATPQGQPVTDFSEQVQVQTTAPTGDIVQPATPIWTEDKISQFYADVTKGNKYSQAEADRIEREIFAFINQQH